MPPLKRNPDRGKGCLSQPLGGKPLASGLGESCSEVVSDFTTEPCDSGSGHTDILYRLTVMIMHTWLDPCAYKLCVYDDKFFPRTSKGKMLTSPRTTE